MDEERFAGVALGEGLIPVGHLRFTRYGGRQFSSFSYRDDWIERDLSFSIAPDLPLRPGEFYASGRDDARDALAGVFTDAAPDSWGRRLLEKQYGLGISEFDLLTLSDDLSRQGALRFLDADGEVIRGQAEAVPRLLDLEEIIRIAHRYERDLELTSEELAALTSAGATLGGARPKANVREGSDLWIAKFTSIHDRSPIERVEVATLELARQAGIRTPEARLELAATPWPVALIRRFDRRGTTRIPYISARTALGKTGKVSGSYTEIAEFIQSWSSDPTGDQHELFRRLIFTILVSNKDDHLRNHGFLYVGSDRWRLSPLFDVNPAPDREAHLETAIMEGGPHTRSIADALDAAEFFALDGPEALSIVGEVARVVSGGWRAALARNGVTGDDARQYQPAFDHEEMDLALALTGAA